ncbi:MAG: Nif11-like leader peptide family natural product precursor [Schwartzia succinivorans]|jgi:hypothetical protein|nr:Nif11-like leader peptide family natural product precursor [Schwartzia succinivorans]
MTDEQRAEKLKEVLSDQAFVEKILEMETAEEVQQALKDKGAEVSVEEINAMWEEIVRQVEGGEELGKDHLKAVSGGCVVPAIIFGIGSAIAAVAASARCVDTCTRNHRRRW